MLRQEVITYQNALLNSTRNVSMRRGTSRWCTAASQRDRSSITLRILHRRRRTDAADTRSRVCSWGQHQYSPESSEWAARSGHSNHVMWEHDGQVVRVIQLSPRSCFCGGILATSRFISPQSGQFDGIGMATHLWRTNNSMRLLTPEFVGSVHRTEEER